MLVCSVVLRPKRGTLAATVVETALAIDSPSISAIFAILTDDPGTASDHLDGFVGKGMAEAASAAAVVNAGSLRNAIIVEETVALASVIPYTPGPVAAAIVETAAANSVQNYAASGPPVTGLIGSWDVSVTASLSLTGVEVNAIADQSGQGNTLTATSASPIYNATGFNSRPAITISPVQGLQKTSFPIGTGNTLTAFFVGTLGTGSSQARFLSYKGGSADYNNAGSFTLRKGAATEVVVDRNNIATTATATASPAPHRIIMTVSSAGVITIYVDGVSAATGTSSGNWISSGIFAVGHNAGGGNYNTAPLAEFGIATGFSDATAVAALDTYLKNKWGL